MWAGHPGWVRTCADCRRWVIDPDTGRVATYPDRDPATGRQVELPMARDAARVPPPCGVCPKAVGGQPVEPDADFAGWFWELVRFAREGRAVGFPPLDPLTRSAVAQVLDAEARADRAADRLAMAAAVRDALRRR